MTRDCYVIFRHLLNQCRDQVRLRIRNGHATERGLALRVGISQPHLHNVLKGIRPMSPDMADRLMGQLGITLAELIPVDPGRQPGRTASR